MVLPSKSCMGSLFGFVHTIHRKICEERLNVSCGWALIPIRMLSGVSMEEIFLQHSAASDQSADVRLEFKDNLVRLTHGDDCIELDWIQAENLFDELKRWMTYRESPEGWSDYWSLAMK